MHSQSDKNSPPTILWVNSDLPYPINSGCRKYTADLLRSIQSEFKIFLLPLDKEPTQQTREHLNNITLLQASRSKQPNATLSKLKSLITRTSSVAMHYTCNKHISDIEKHYKEIQPDIVVLNHIRSGINILELDLHKTPTVYIAHNAESHASKTIAQNTKGITEKFFIQDSKKLRALESRIIAKCTATITLTKEDEIRLNKLDPNEYKISTIPPTIRTPQHYLELHHRKRRLLITGSFKWKPKKDNLAWFIKEVFLPLQQIHSNIEIHIVGHGSTDAIRNFRNNTGIKHYDNVKNVYKHYEDDMIFVIPERQAGGIKIKTIEAASMGIPIVSTKEGIEGCYLEHNKNCLVSDSADEFKNNITELLLNQKIGQKLAAASRAAYKQHFEPNNSAVAFRDHILDLCSTL